MRGFLVAMVAMMGVVLSGCIESQDAYILNQDGSGKVLRSVIFQPGMDMSAAFTMSDDSEPIKKTPAEELNAAAKAELEQSEGVEAWKDVKVNRGKDGRIVFSGIAYFKDFNAVKFHNGGFSMSTKPSWTKEASGKYRLEFTPKADGDGAISSVEKPASPKALTDAEIKAEIAQAREEYKDTMGMMRQGLSSLKMSMIFRVPGKLESSRNFQISQAGHPLVVFKGESMITAMDALMKDDKWMVAQIKAGVDFGAQGEGPDDDVMNEKIFGQKGSVMAMVSAAGAAPLFDYASEVAEAKKGYPAILKQFGAAGAGGITKAVKTPAAEGAPMTDMAVEQLSLKADDNFVPTVRAKGKLSCLAMSADEGKVEKAITDNGENILPEEEFNQKIHFPRLADDKMTVEGMDMEIKAPSANAKSIKEISGYLLYSVSEGTRIVDLGLTELTAGSKGTELRADITEVKEDQWTPGVQEIEIEVGIKNESIKAAKLFDSAGKEIAVENCDIRGFFDKATIKLGVKGTIPKTGGIKLELHDNIKQFKAPFTIKDIPLSMAE